MSHSRRSFIKTAATSLSVAPIVSAFANNPNRPIILSTWNFGMQANEAAWKILSENGRALDAVEAAARVPESDVTNTTVGIGGAPDRDSGRGCTAARSTR